MSLDLTYIFHARLAVARLGELDVHGWWRTEGVLGEDGAFVGSRVVPFTHPNVRARISFAVAAHACDKIYPDPKAFHLFRLSPALEDQLDDLLQTKLGQKDCWGQEMEGLEHITKGADTLDVLLKYKVITLEEAQLIKNLPLGAANRSVAIPPQSDSNKLIRLLTAGFILSTSQQLVVPYTHAVVDLI